MRNTMTSWQQQADITSPRIYFLSERVSNEGSADQTPYSYPQPSIRSRRSI